MINLILADLFKLRKMAAARILFLMMCISCALMIFMSYSIAKGSIGIETSGSASFFIDVVMMSIAGCVIAGLFICGDFENKTINDAIAGGCSRESLVISKSIVFFILTAIMLLPYCIITVIALLTGAKFTAYSNSLFLNILAEKSGAAMSGPEVFKFIALILTLLIVYWGQLSICILLAFLMKKRPVLVIAISFFVSMFCGLISAVKDSLGLFGKLLNYTPFGVFAKVTLDAKPGDLIFSIVISILFIILLLLITYRTFRKSELK